MHQSRISQGRREEAEGAAPRPTQIAAIIAFVLVNLVAPLLIGELFPFSVSPMFCHKPAVYCEYKVSSLTENQYLLFDSQIHRGPSFVTAEGHLDFGLQQIYDGIPAGLGAGVKPPATVNVFGKIATEAEVRRIVGANLRRMHKKGVRVEQLVYGAIDEEHIGILETNEWIITISDDGNDVAESNNSDDSERVGERK